MPPDIQNSGTISCFVLEILLTPEVIFSIVHKKKVVIIIGYFS